MNNIESMEEIIERAVERAEAVLYYHKQLIDYMPDSVPDYEDIASLLCDIRFYFGRKYGIDFDIVVRESWGMWAREHGLHGNENFRRANKEQSK